MEMFRRNLYLLRLNLDPVKKITDPDGQKSPNLNPHHWQIHNYVDFSS